MMALDAANTRQRGAALLLLMLIVLVASAAVLLANVNSDDLRTQSLNDTQQRLAEAKAALIDYAVLHPDANPGQPFSLPCPDLGAGGGFAEGAAHTSNCGAAGVTMLGRLPWRTLGMAVPRDASSECLWYVVSGSFKNADLATSTMINEDTNGQLQLVELDSGTVIEGAQAQDRPVAMVIAAMRPVAGQTRPAVQSGQQCSPGFNAPDFLDVDGGISNAVVGGVVDGLDTFASYGGIVESHNDRIVTVSRAEIARGIVARSDFDSNMRDLGLGAAACLAYYATTNPGGTNDKRLPWPAAMTLADYRDDTAYGDVDNGMYTGRLPDAVDDSNAETGNAVGRVLSECDPLLVPQWSAALLSRWQHWKDHFYYAVAESHLPTASVPSTCSNCLTVNGAGQYIAILLFAGSRLDGQVRNAPPLDADTKRDAGNYLEASNAVNVPAPGTFVDYASQATSDTFNDRLFCIDESLLVTEC